MNQLTRPTMAPYVNLNGTHRDDLIEQHQRVADYLYETMRALSEVRPNARDYQTAPKAAYGDALAAHSALFAAIDKVRNDVLDVVQFLMDEGAQR